jgi:hypothetical protein
MPTKYAVKANDKGHSLELVELASIREIRNPVLENSEMISNLKAVKKNHETLLQSLAKVFNTKPIACQALFR